MVGATSNISLDNTEKKRGTIGGNATRTASWAHHNPAEREEEHAKLNIHYASSDSVPPTQGHQALLGRSFQGGCFQAEAQILQLPGGSKSIQSHYW